jgi:predicted metal-dependent hydrolase
MHNQEFSIEIIRKNIKHIYLRVLPNNIVRITAPKRTSQRTINLLLKNKKEWILKSLQHQEKRSQFQAPFTTGELHYVQGIPHVLHIKPGTLKTEVYIENNKLIVKPGSNSTEARIENLINEWHRNQLKQRLPEMIEKWEKQMQVVVNDFGIKKMKTRWGSCNIHTHRIWLNLALAKTPPECLEYVLVHEMVHLLEPSHNHRFKSLMTLYLPEWQTHTQTLKQFPVL